MEEKVIVKISKKVRDILLKMRVDMDKRSISEVIEQLIKKNYKI